MPVTAVIFKKINKHCEKSKKKKKGEKNTKRNLKSQSLNSKFSENEASKMRPLPVFLTRRGKKLYLGNENKVDN